MSLFWSWENVSGRGNNFSIVGEVNGLGGISGNGDSWFIFVRVIDGGIYCSGGFRKWRRGDMSGKDRREYWNG